MNESLERVNLQRNKISTDLQAESRESETIGQRKAKARGSDTDRSTACTAGAKQKRNWVQKLYQQIMAATRDR
jgi:hypothetical protein